MCHYIVRWNTPSGSNNHDLLRDRILERIGINREDIVSDSINPSISQRTEPFTVEDIHGRGRQLAGQGHEMLISGGISFRTTNGDQYQVEELYYQDLTGHGDGINHFNCEMRITHPGGSTDIIDRNDPLLEDHRIPWAEYIELEMRPSGNVENTLTRRVPHS